jgi:serine/threonine protein phosphatase PrpC
MVQPQEIQEVLRRSVDLQAASRQLIEMANARGGEDNTTVVLVAVGEALRGSLWERIRHRFLGEASAVMAKKEEPSWQR